MQTRLRSCVGLGVGAWLLAHPTTPTFHLSPTHFFIALRTHLGLPHAMVAHLSQCQCGRTIDDLNNHLFQCPCGSEHIVTHDTFWDNIVIIILEKWSTCSKGGLPPFPSSHPT
jgi:hypothetical protein